MPSATTDAPRQAASAADAPEPAGELSPPRATAGSARAWRPTKTIVTRRLNLLAERAGSSAAQQQFSTLGRRVRAGGGASKGGAGKRANRLDAALDALLCEAAANTADRLLLLEAATWAIAWRLGSKQPGRSEEHAARVLEQAASATADLADGDTSAAAFVLTASRLLGLPDSSEGHADGETLAWTTCEAEILRLVTRSGCVALDGSAAMLDRVARWTHVRETATATAKAVRRPKKAFASKAERRWRQAAACMLRLLGPRGTPVAGDHATLPRNAGHGILQAALTFGGKRARLAAQLMQQPRGSADERDALPPNLHAPDAATTVFRSRWQGSAIRAFLDYRREQPHLEIACGKRMLIAGTWQWDVRLGTTVLAAEGPWQVTHEEEIDDASILVISAPLSQGLRLERHLVLAPQDRVLLLADAIVEAAAETAPGEISYRCSLPVPASIDVAAAEETRELTLASTKPQAMLMPLAFNEWKAGRAPGACVWDSDARQIQLTHASPVRRLFAPLWLDLDPRRFGTQVTWRQLTVADTRVILRPEQAAGFRVQAGLTNWLLYRALDEPRNRTVLGCNISSYFRLGQLGTDGLVTQMAEW